MEFMKSCQLRKISFLCIFLLAVMTTYGHVAEYKFDGTPSDHQGGTDATFIIAEVETYPTEIVYTAGFDDQAVYLDSASGFKLPMDVTDALMSSNVWSFQLRFKITDHGAGDGQRMLINLKKPGTRTPPYFRLFTKKEDDTQGRVVFQMENRDLRVQQYAFFFDLDEWVSLTFIVDFEQGYYILSSDNYYVSSNFSDFDYEQFKTYGNSSGLQNQRLHIGYYQELGARQAHPSYSTAYTSELVIDELLVSNTTPTTDASVYENALEQLTNHLTGDITLSAEDISTYTSQVLTNFRDNYITSKTIVDAYFDAYENVYDPMFRQSNWINIYEDYDEFGWVLFNLQLDVFDNYVTNEHIDHVADLAFETAEGFPGPVAETAERLEDQLVTISGTYMADPGYNKKILEKGYGDIARRGTGYYAAPGELISVTVPDALVGIGADVVIGTFTHDISNKIASGIRRFPRAIKEFEITQSTMEVISPLGGIIYIYIPEGSDFGDLNISLSGAVKFAYYEQSSTNTGDITDFQTRLESAEVLWAEVVTDNFMYTGPLAYFKFDDTMQTLETWDNMWEAYQLYNGRPFPLHKAEHMVHDKMTKWNTLAGGYPMNLAVGTMPYVDDFWGSTGEGHMMNILEFDKAIHDNKATYWHEMSHHTGLPTLPNEVECIVELAFMVTNHLGNNMPLDSAFKYASRGYQTRDDAIIDWVVMDEFRNNEEMTQTQRQYQQRGYSKYVDVGVLFGWDALGSINKVFYNYWTSIGGQTNDPELNIITDTEWILASCEALNVNVAPLYHFWGEQPNDTIMATVNSYPRSEEIYLRLRDIRDFIPKTAEDFQPYFDAHAPSNTNSQNYHPYQDALGGWNTNLLYDSIIMQIDSLLFLYYDGDFDQDGILFYDDCNDTDASISDTIIWYADADGDGAGDINVVLTQCKQPEGYVSNSEDCDDTRFEIQTIEETHLDVVTCDLFQFNDQDLMESGLYQATYLNLAGCDSLVTLNLTILESDAEIETISTCDSYAFDGQTLTQSGQYNGLFMNQAGCDSLVTLNLTILESDAETETISTCDSYEFDGQTLTHSGQYNGLFMNQAGCDSLVTLNLTINELPDVSVNLNAFTLSAVSDLSYSYQWYDCNTNQPLEGETNRQLIAKQSGNYAVEVDNGECSVMSECYEVLFPLATLDATGLLVYPSLMKDQLTIELPSFQSMVSVRVTDINGKEVFEKSFQNTGSIPIRFQGNAGLYLIQIESEKIKATLKIVKTN